MSTGTSLLIILVLSVSLVIQCTTKRIQMAKGKGKKLIISENVMVIMGKNLFKLTTTEINW